MFESLKGKNVLISGANSGIGAEASKLFASYGTNVGIHYGHDDKKAKEIEGALKKYGVKTLVLKADLAKPENASGLVEKFAERFGTIDVLVNNAGAVTSDCDFLELAPEDFRKSLDLNLTSPFVLAQKAFEKMKGSGGGRIINVSSISAKYGGGRTSMNYGAAKAGLEAITRGMARAGAEHNILVNAVSPGFIDTEFHSNFRTEDQIKKRISMIPLKRAGKPEDVARMIVFLASEAGDFITGQTIAISGGD